MCEIIFCILNSLPWCPNSLKTVYIFSNCSQVQAGPAGRKKKAVTPFVNLKADVLSLEVNCRGLDREIPHYKKQTKKDFEILLKEDLAGISRAPALCYGNENIKMEKLNLSMYEVCPIEPLHDCKGHIKNIWEALQEALDKPEKELLSQILEGCYGSKDKVTGSDYRLSTIIVYQNMKGKCLKDTEDLLLTLVEITKLAYTKAKYRNQKYILRLYNITFKHAMLCINQLRGAVKKISVQKLFGVYFHSITSHLPQVARIIAPSSIHTEDEERMFSKINNISLNTSTRTSQSIRDNGIVRMQAEQKFQEMNGISLSSCESKISKFSESIGINNT